ncbi:MAG: hypothetical protein JXN65_01470 [Clostridia bacterium]|nr:hypothetical protein [Clostridia bacterium]
MTVNFTPSLVMALTDFIPVILFLAGSIVLSCYMKRNSCTVCFVLFILGALIVNFGGFAKATWKLLLATSGKNIPWLDDLQFLFMGIGTLLIFISLLSLVVRKKKQEKFLVPAAIFTIKDTNMFYYLLALVIISTTGYLACLAILSAKQKNRISMIFYIIYWVISLAMGGLSGKGELESVNWIAQSINTLGMLLLLAAHIRLNKRDIEMKAENAA